MKRRKLLVGNGFPVAAFWVAGILFAVGFSSSAAPAAPGRVKAVVAIEKVTEREDFESRRYTGQVVSRSVVQIVPRVSGEILEVGFSDGALVKRGQMLYKLDPVQYEAAVKSAEAKIAECKAKLTYAQNNYVRNLTLYEKNAASLDSMENTRSSLNAYKASLMAAEAELITARDNLKNTAITSPMDGLAGVTRFTPGNYLTPGAGELVTVIQLQPIRVRFSISTADFLSMFGSLSALRDNGVVRVKLADGSWYATPGKIEFLNNEANRKTDAIQIYATFPNADYKLIVGSTVGVTLAKKKGKTVPAVTPAAVMHDSDGAYVFVVEAGNKARKQYVIPGNTTPEFQLIRSGLKKGESVVVQGTHKVVDGGEIEPVPAIGK